MLSPILLIAVPLITAFISILFKKLSPYLLLVVSFAAVIALNYMELGEVVIGGFNAPYGINLVLDQYSLYGLYAVNVLFFLVVALNCVKFSKLATVLLVSLAGLNGLLLTGDLFNLFVFLEISGIAAYLITTSNKKPLATFNYLVAGTVGSSLYLLGLIIIYAIAGTLNMADLASIIAAGNLPAAALSFPLLLMFIGLGVEAKLLPFNAWVKNILGSANRLSGPMIASVYAAAMTLVFGRILLTVFNASEALGVIATTVVLVSIIAGEAMAFASTRVKEILLFSSVAQAGLVILLFLNGFSGWAVIMIIANAVSKFILFMVTTIIEEQTGTDETSELKGVLKSNKLVGLAYTVASLSVLGLPIFIGFVVKMNVLIELINMNHLWFVGIILVASVVEGVYFVRLLINLWYGEEKHEVKFDFILQYIVVILAVLIVVFGTYSAPITTAADDFEIIAEGGTYNG